MFLSPIYLIYAFPETHELSNNALLCPSRPSSPVTNMTVGMPYLTRPLKRHVEKGSGNQKSSTQTHRAYSRALGHKFLGGAAGGHA